MTPFNAHQHNLPPGCTDPDGGHGGDTYQCERCGEGKGQEDMDPASGMCRQCAREEAEEARTEDELNAQFREQVERIVCQRHTA